MNQTNYLTRLWSITVQYYMSKEHPYRFSETECREIRAELMETLLDASIMSLKTAPELDQTETLDHPPSVSDAVPPL